MLDYDASLVDNGLFRSRVAGDWYAWTAFGPAGARTAFPGFDEPRFKTPFTLSVKAPASDLVISNARDMRIEKRGSTTRHILAAMAPLPTYLFQLAIGPFATGSTTAASTAWRKQPLPIRAFATRDKKDELAFALANMGPFERLIEAYVGQPYPFAKLGAVTTPDVLLEGVPSGMSLPEIRAEIANVAGVGGLHDLHIWSMSNDDVSATMHVTLAA